MPKYEVTDSVTGKKYELEGDSPPTDQELSDIFGAAEQSPSPIAETTPIPLAKSHKPEAQWSDLPGNILPNAGKVVKDIATAVMHPIDTATALGTLAIPSIPGLMADPALRQKAMDAYGAIGTDLKEKWSDPKTYLTQKPVEALLDVSTLLGGAGAAVKATGKVPTIAKALSTASQYTDPLKAIGKGTELAAKGLTKAAAGASSVATGAGYGAYMEALKNHPGFRAGISGQVTEEALAGRLMDKLMDIADTRAADYQAGLRGLKSTGAALASGPSERALDASLQRFGILTDPATGELITAGVRGGEDITAAAQKAKEAIANFHQVGDYTPYGYDTLRMQLREVAQSSPKAKNMLDPVMNNIKGRVESFAPGYKKMLGDYEAASNKLSELKKALSISGEGASKDTAIRKMGTIHRDVNKYRLAKLEQLDPTGELQAMAAGIAMKSGMPRGHLSRLLSIGGGTGLALLMQSLPAAFAAAVAASPRVAGELFNLAGKAGRVAEKAAPAAKPAYYAERAADDIQNVPAAPSPAFSDGQRVQDAAGNVYTVKQVGDKVFAVDQNGNIQEVQ